MTALKFAPVVEPRHVFVDIAGLTGVDHAFVAGVLEAEREAQGQVIALLSDLDLPVPRALEILLSALLRTVGVLAEQMQVAESDYLAIARAARDQVCEGILVGSDVMGVS